MRELIAITKALADENRVRILRMLAGGELCVCQIVEVLALAPSTISKHLALLAAARLVESRKDGRWVYYRLPGNDARAPARSALAWLFASVGDDPVLRNDHGKLTEILGMTKETLCRMRARR